MGNSIRMKNVQGRAGVINFDDGDAAREIKLTDIQLISDLTNTLAKVDVLSGGEGGPNNIVISNSGSSVTELEEFGEYTFIVEENNTDASVTIKIDALDPVPLVGLTAADQLFATALLTVRYISGSFYISKQINPKTGNDVLDIGKLETDTVDILRPGEFLLNGEELNRADHPIAFSIISKSSNYIDQSTKDGNTVTYGGYYGDGDGSTTFTLPSIEGEFIRMHGSGRLFGSWQDSDNKSHDHVIGANVVNTGVNTGNTFGSANGAGLAISTSGTSYSGGGEARPRNIAYYGKTRL